MILQKLCTNIAWMQHKCCRDIVTNCTKACTVPCRAPAWVGTSRPWSLSARPTGQPFNITIIIIITLHPHHCQNVRMAPCCLENMYVPNKWCSFLTAHVLYGTIHHFSLPATPLQFLQPPSHSTPPDPQLFLEHCTMQCDWLHTVLYQTFACVKQTKSFVSCSSSFKSDELSHKYDVT